MNLLFSLNKGYVDTFLNCLISIERSGGADHYDIYILNSDFDRQTEQIVRRHGKKSVFHFVHVDPALFDGFPEFKRYPRQIYYRIIAPLLLPEDLDRILYLDADIVVINPLTGLYNEDFEGNWYIGCTHANLFLELINKIRLGVVDDAPYINTGVMMFNLEKLHGQIDIAKIRNYVCSRKQSFLLPDQDIIFGMYGTKIKLVDTVIYNLSDRMLMFYNSDPSNKPIDLRWIRQNTVVVHYCGRNKPWKKGYSGLLGTFYYELMLSLSAPPVPTETAEKTEE